MKLSYNKLWKMLIDKNMQRNDLQKTAGVSSASIAKFGRGDNISTEVLIKICTALNCRGGGNIFEIIDE